MFQSIFKKRTNGWGGGELAGSQRQGAKRIYHPFSGASLKSMDHLHSFCWIFMGYTIFYRIIEKEKQNSMGEEV